jgi:hypothetical protein
MCAFNGLRPMVDDRPATPVSIDACPVASGGHYAGQFVYTRFDMWTGSCDLHINHKEVLALLPAAYQRGPLWANKKVYVHCDNQTAVAIINKGSCNNPFVLPSTSLYRYFVSLCSMASSVIKVFLHKTIY